MKILAMDTGFSNCSVSILENRQVRKVLELTNHEKVHSEQLMPLIKQILEETNLSLKDMELICFNRGPRFFYWNSNWYCYFQSFFGCFSNPYYRC